MESRKFLAVMIGVIALLGQAVSAAPIVAIDYDTIALTQGPLVAGPSTDEFMPVPVPGAPSSVGTLENQVFLNRQIGVYTYTHFVTPQNSDNILAFTTGFAPMGFNGVAGYSFLQAAAAEVVFTVDLSPAGTLTWQATSFNWNPGEGITFFFQSTAPPGAGGVYNIFSNPPGTGVSFQPIPAPMALYGGMLLMGLVIATSRHRRRQ